ncbi:MAG TPA: hypothetical protein VIV12_06620 [Streptosporangiaceae bacterium]
MARRRAGRSRIGLTIDVEVFGPLFEAGVPEHVIHDFLDETKEEVAQLGYNEVRARLGSVLKHPTGHYESRIRTERASRYNDQVITDGGVIYGNWLEGTSQRNKTTRFKGYRVFRRIRLKLRKQVTPIAQQNLDHYLQRLR